MRRLSLILAVTLSLAACAELSETQRNSDTPADISEIQGYARAMLICRDENAILSIAAAWQKSRKAAVRSLTRQLRQRLCVTLPRPRVVGLVEMVYEYVDIDGDLVEVWEIDTRDVPMWTLVMADDQPEPETGA